MQVEVRVDRSEPLTDASPLSELLGVVFAKLDVASLCPVRALPSLPPNAQIFRSVAYLRLTKSSTRSNRSLASLSEFAQDNMFGKERLLEFAKL